MNLKNTRFNLIFSLLLLGSILVSSCKKYDDGPSISFRSKISRLFGYWKMEKWIENNVEINSQLKFQHQFGFAKDGTYYYSFTDTTTDTSSNFTGTWQFRHDREQLVLGLQDPLNGMEYKVWDIKRLAYKEIWLENISPGLCIDWHLASE